MNIFLKILDSNKDYYSLRLMIQNRLNKYCLHYAYLLFFLKVNDHLN